MSGILKKKIDVTVWGPIVLNKYKLRIMTMKYKSSL